MLWIVWTCAWWLTVAIAEYLDELTFKVRGEKPTNEARGAEAIMLLAVWIIGMVKFWPS